MTVLLLSLLLAQPQDADHVLAEMAKKASGTNTVQADYEKIKVLSLLDETTKAKGKFTFRRENRAVRWEASDGSAIQQVDGDRYVTVYHSLKEVEIFALDKRGKNLASMMGAPDVANSLKKDFEISLVSRNGKHFELKLVPRTADLKKRATEARLIVSNSSYLILEASYSEPNGDSTRIVFRNHKVNEKIPDGRFRLDIDGWRKGGYKIIRH